MKKLHLISKIFLVFVLIFSLITWKCNFSLALIWKGLNPKDVFTIEHSFGINKKEFKIIKTSSKDDTDKLAILTKNNLGMWNIFSTSNNTKETPNLIRFGWIQSAGARRYEYSENAFLLLNNLIYKCIRDCCPSSLKNCSIFSKLSSWCRY